MTRSGLLVVALLALLTACTSVAPPSGRATQGAEARSKVFPPSDKDGAPPESLDPDSIADAVPRAEVLRLAGNMSPYVVNGVSYKLVEDHRGFRQRGIASWYGTKFHGKATSNGEIYSLYEMSAAHRTLPIPVYVKVKNLDNGREAIVRVNDRGPFHSDRVIDLSYAAAVKLGFARQGTAPVEIEVIDTDNSQAGVAARYFLQVGAFQRYSAAEQLQQSLVPMKLPIQINSQGEGGDSLHRVRIGPLADFPAAQAARRQLREFWTGEPTLLVEEGGS